MWEYYAIIEVHITRIFICGIAKYPLNITDEEYICHTKYGLLQVLQEVWD